MTKADLPTGLKWLSYWISRLFADPDRTGIPAAKDWLHEIKHDGYRLIVQVVMQVVSKETPALLQTLVQR